MLPSKLSTPKQMKYLETNLICILNVVSLPVGIQHDIAHEISESTVQTCKIKIAAATFMNMRG